MMPVLSIYRVTAAGAISLAAANVPYEEVLWTRRMSAPGEFAARLACRMPVTWPGRYLVALSGRAEVGVIEKVAAEEGSLEQTDVSGRFAECLYSRYRFGADGASARGANWRQALTSALGAWLMPDAPPMAMGGGTRPATGQGFAVTGEAGRQAAEAIYACSYEHGSMPLVSLSRGGLTASIVTGLDRTRGQRENPLCILSVAQGSSTSAAYTGDYTPACSEVIAHAELDRGDEGAARVDRTVPVPGFDPETMWRAAAYEDVSSLIGQGVVPTPANVDAAGSLRAYDHQAAIDSDVTVTGAGYRELWDVCDLVEVDMPRMGISLEARIEEVRETHGTRGSAVEATVGTKRISRVRRAMMERR